jgi:hypothetical protein
LKRVNVQKVLYGTRAYTFLGKDTHLGEDIGQCYLRGKNMKRMKRRAEIVEEKEKSGTIKVKLNF